MFVYKAFRRLYKAFVRILLFLYKDSTRLLQSIYKVFTKRLQCFYNVFLQGSYKLLRSWFMMFYKDFRFVFARCFTRLLYGFYVFYKVFTRI